MKVSEVAKDLDLKPFEVIKQAKSFGFSVKSPVSELSDDEVEMLYESFLDETEVSESEPEVEIEEESVEEELDVLADDFEEEIEEDEEEIEEEITPPASIKRKVSKGVMNQEEKKSQKAKNKSSRIIGRGAEKKKNPLFEKFAKYGREEKRPAPDEPKTVSHSFSRNLYALVMFILIAFFGLTAYSAFQANVQAKKLSDQVNQSIKVLNDNQKVLSDAIKTLSEKVN